MTHFDDDGFRFIGLREEPLENPFNRAVKRTIDFVTRAADHAFRFPAARGRSSGSRNGCNRPGRSFISRPAPGSKTGVSRFWKFRTMHPRNHDLARQATNEDDRVYPLGRWFRKLSIDEIPQFWNVLRGDMSVVGPRPHLIEHNAQFSQLMANYQVRTFVKPGITGLAQVRGFRGEAQTSKDIQNRVACDIEYLENWNLTLECRDHRADDGAADRAAALGLLGRDKADPAPTGTGRAEECPSGGTRCRASSLVVSP